jgi:chaperone BCS1
MYDIYDIELTDVKTNAELKKLLIGITRKPVVIDDIDCFLDLTGQRKTYSEKEMNHLQELQEAATTKKSKMMSQVTLSGFLNFIGGIWSARTSERLIVFTTN